MNVEIISQENVVCALIKGDLDHHTARLIRSEIDKAVNEKTPSVLILDFSAVTFMDSSGIGLVMGRYKLMSQSGGDVVVAKPPAYIRKVMKLAGINQLARIVSDYKLTGSADKDNKSEEVDKIEAKAN